MKKPASDKTRTKEQKLLNDLEEARKNSDLFRYDRILKELHKLRSPK